MNLALVENGVITHISVGELTDSPDRIDATGQLWGIGWTDNGDGTFSPPVFVQEYHTNFSADDLLSYFDEDEMDLIVDSVNPVVKRFVRRLELQKSRPVIVNPKYISDIGVLRTEVLISQARHDELIQGLPI